MHSFPKYPLANSAIAWHSVKQQMPHRFEAIFSLLGATLLGMWGTFVAVAQLLVRQTIIDDDEKRLWCILGAVGGAVFMGLYTMEQQNGITIKKVVLKIFASSVAGIIITPGLMHLCSNYLPATSDTLMLASAVVAMSAVGALKIGIPIVQAVFERWLRRWSKSLTDTKGDEK